MKTIEEILAYQIKTRRKKLKMSQTELARLAKLSETTINRLEKGKQRPQAGNMEAIAEALGCHVEELFRLPVAEPSPSPSQSALVQTIAVLQSEIDELKAELERIPEPVREFLRSNDVNWTLAAPALGMRPTPSNGKAIKKPGA